MTTRKYIHIALIALVTMVTSCKSDDEPTPPDEQTNRTILVYMAANNSLGDYGFDADDITEMTEAVADGALQGGRLLVYRTDYKGVSKLVELTKKGRKEIKTYGDDGLSSVHGTRMLNVINDARKAAPSDDFGIILWSHGMGWLQNGINDPDFPTSSPKAALQTAAESAAGALPGKKRTWGEERDKKMNITTLAQVLEKVHPDFVYFDCCYMASVEVAYQLRNSTPYIVGSATELIAEGMPYRLTLPYLFAPGEPDLTGAARATFSYVDSKTDPEQRTCTMSVISTAGMTDLALAARDIHAASASTWPLDYEPQAFMLEQSCTYFDLDHYMQALCDRLDDGETLRARWNRALQNVVMYSAATPYLWNSLPLDAHCGLSTYILRNQSYASNFNYNKLEWPHAAGIIKD